MAPIFRHVRKRTGRLKAAAEATGRLIPRTGKRPASPPGRRRARLATSMMIRPPAKSSAISLNPRSERANTPTPTIAVAAFRMAFRPSSHSACTIRAMTTGLTP